MLIHVPVQICRFHSTPIPVLYCPQYRLQYMPPFVRVNNLRDKFSIRIYMYEYCV